MIKMALQYPNLGYYTSQPYLYYHSKGRIQGFDVSSNLNLYSRIYTQLPKFRLFYCRPSSGFGSIDLNTHKMQTLGASINLLVRWAYTSAPTVYYEFINENLNFPDGMPYTDVDILEMEVELPVPLGISIQLQAILTVNSFSLIPECPECPECPDEPGDDEMSEIVDRICLKMGEKQLVIEEKLQLIVDALKCGENSLACVVQNGLTSHISEKPLASIVEEGLVGGDGKTLVQAVREIEPVWIENELKVDSTVIKPLDGDIS